MWTPWPWVIWACISGLGARTLESPYTTHGARSQTASRWVPELASLCFKACEFSGAAWLQGPGGIWPVIPVWDEKVSSLKVSRAFCRSPGLWLQSFHTHSLRAAALCQDLSPALRKMNKKRVSGGNKLGSSSAPPQNILLGTTRQVGLSFLFRSNGLNKNGICNFLTDELKVAA